MNAVNNAAHAAVLVLGSFTRFLLAGIDGLENAMRGLMHGVGLSADLQTLLVIFITATLMLGVLRLLKGRIRLTTALFLFLFLAHALEHIARVQITG